jgi:hypothetical protein
MTSILPQMGGAGKVVIVSCFRISRLRPRPSRQTRIAQSDTRGATKAKPDAWAALLTLCYAAQRAKFLRATGVAPSSPR